MSKAITSQFNRAYQTAKLAGFDPVEKNIDITEGGLVVSPNENNRRAAAFRKLASTPPPTGTNVVIVTHKPNILDAFGKDWFEIKEGEATIFKPDGAAYKAVARVQMDEWPRSPRRRGRAAIGGTSRPSALAVLRLITSSYLVGACTGRSAGFSPLRMRST